MKKVLITASVISFIEWFNQENIDFLCNDLGCEVHVACNLDYMEDTDVARTEAYVEKKRREGVVFHNIPFDRSPFGKKNLTAYKMLKQLTAAHHFDLIHCHTPMTSMLTRAAARKSRRGGTVVMYTCHGFHFHNASSKKNWMLYYPAEKWFSRYCDYLVTINREDYNRACGFHTKNVRYIPGVGVDLKKIQTTVVDKKQYKKSLGIPEDAVIMISIGELIDRKNHAVIIRAMSGLSRADLYYVICGKGPLRQELQTLAEELGVADRVIFAGFRNDIPELCKTADIGAFPSKIEGLGLAGIEMMAAGIPLVSSNVHGILDYVQDGKTGYACPPDDVQAFAAAIEKLAESPENREKMRQSCLSAVAPFDIDNALSAMWGIYREIIEE